MPIGNAMRPPATTASRTGHPWSLANWAVVSPPTPPKVILQSQTIPPSPMTNVNDSKITPYANPAAIRPSH